ncbi:MAG: deoxyribodipyrimidine photo-lyase [Bacteroidales bacterium]|jgi:deoxyribodipyrimidine photo-lyase
MKEERINYINDKPINKEGSFVLYKMQASVRINHNLALEAAICKANELDLPLKIIFRIDTSFPEANYRHFVFMIQGIKDIQDKLINLGASFEIITNKEDNLFLNFINNAASIIMDKNYLRIQKEWKNWIEENANCEIIEIEDNIIVPVSSTSYKAEWAARTIRPKIMSKIDYFTDDSISLTALKHKAQVNIEQINRNNKILKHTLKKLKENNYLSEVEFKGGETYAKNILKEFIDSKLTNYDINHNDPSLKGSSLLSPYIHFGQISPITIVQELKHNPKAEKFIEQLVVRRELAINYTYFTPDYDKYSSIPLWAKNTLEKHKNDNRSILYNLEKLEQASTLDKSWNASMIEMVETGYMENTMRMYWGKKIIEWSPTPEEAYSRMVYLNNKYFLDGRDPNSYAGIGWCFGLHDRPWKERSIFGMVRYMNEAGLQRKYKIEDYISKYSKP